MFESNRSLLNPKFETYQFHALDDSKVISHYPLTHRPTQTTLSGRSLLSFQEVQSRIRHNHLTVGPAGCGRAVYIDAEFNVVGVNVDGATLVPSFQVLYELPRPIQTSSSGVDAPQREYPSAAFVTPSRVLVSDGCGALYALEIPETGPANLINSYELIIPEKYQSSRANVPFRLHTVQQTSFESCIAILSSKHAGAPTPKDKSKTKPKNHVEFDIWAVNINLASMSQDQAVPLDIIWHRLGNNVPSYIAYDETRKAFMFVGGSTYRALNVPPTPSYEPSADEIAPIPRAGENLDAGDLNQSTTSSTTPIKPPPYSWTQTSDSVTVAFPLPSSIPKSAIKVTFTPRTLTVLVGGDNVDTEPLVPLPRYSLKQLWDGIQPSTSFWTWDKEAEHKFGLLTLHIDKQHEGTRWSHVFASVGTKSSQPSTTSSLHEDTDIEVPETVDPSELYHIRETLEKYTAALQRGEDPSGLNLGHGVPNLGQGEMDDEIDLSTGEIVSFTWINAEDGSVPSWSTEHGVDSPFNLLSTPFPGSIDPLPTLIVKNSLDGTVFNLEAGSNPDDPPVWKHTSTFPALSFVLATKRDTRFVHHISSQAVLVFESGPRDSGGNVYIYGKTASVHDPYAKSAVLKIGGGGGGSLLGVGMMQTKEGEPVILCLCEGEWIVVNHAVS